MKSFTDPLRLGLLLTGIVMIIAGACAPLYVPPATHVPALEKRGQGDAAVFIGASGFDGQVAYSPWNNVMLRAAGSYDTEESADDMRAHTHTYVEIAGGPYTASRKGLRAHLLGGVGWGSAAMTDPTFSTQPDTVTATYWRLFAQGYVGFRSQPSSGSLYNPVGFNGLTEYGVAARYALVPFSGIVRNREHIANRSASFLELQGVVRLGSENVGVEIQAGPVIRLDGQEEDLGIRTWFTTYVGLRARF